MSQRQKVVWRNARAGLFALGLLCGSVAFAQATSVLTGNVVDAATKAPVADVVVTATSPNLQGEQVVVTDATGLYRVPQLPPGVYTLRFEKESYRPFSRTAIDVAADKQLRLNVELLPETAGSETVTVVGTPPTIDVGSSTTGTTVSQDFVRNLAVSRPGGLGGANRSFETLALVAPQVQSDLYGVGINGTTSPENLYLIDGLSVNNTGFGTNGSQLTSEFVDEVNVITGGYLPEYGRTTGGAVSATTKTGGNEFHGSIWGTFTPGSLTGTPGIVPTTSRVISTSREQGNFGDMGATLGGYIIKDRLWFFAGIQWAAQRYIFHRSFSYQDTTQSPAAYVPIDNSTQTRFGDERSWNYIGKLTFLISQDHRLSVTVTGTPTTSGGDGAFPVRTTSQTRGVFAAGNWGTGDYNTFNVKAKFNSLDIAGEYNGSFLDKKLLLDIRGGWHHQGDEDLPGDGSGLAYDNRSTLAGTPSVRLPSTPANIIDVAANPELPASVLTACAITTGRNCNVTNWYVGGPQLQMYQATFDSYQGRALLTYLLTGAGHHVLKAGFDGQVATYERKEYYPGGALYRYAGDFGGPDAYYDYRRYGIISGVDTIIDTPLLDVNTKSTVLGGFVQDSWSIMDKVTLNLGLRYDSEHISNIAGRTGIALNDQWSPRIGVVYDPTQQGKSKLYANYGRYYEYIPLDIAVRSLSGEQTIVGFHACNPLTQYRQGCDANTVGTSVFGNNPGAPAFYNGDLLGASTKWTPVGNAFSSSVDPNLKSPSSDEFVVGGEYEVLPNARAGLSYTHRNVVNWVEDMSNNNAVSYFVGNPGQGIATNFPKPERNYDAVTVSFVKNFSDLWLAQISYTWSRLTGNIDGLFVPSSTQLDPNINATFDLVSLLGNATGPLSGDVTHAIKAYLAKEFAITPVLSITGGVSFNAFSGIPISALGTHPIYGAGYGYIIERGSAGRLPWNTSLDLNLGVNYRFTKDMVLTGRVEAFNVFNSQRPTTVSENYTTATISPILGATQGTITQTYPQGAGNPPIVAGGVCTSSAVSSCTPGNGSLPVPVATSNGSAIRVGLPNTAGNLQSALTLLNWGKPTAYQAVRQFRFSIRLSF